MGGVVHCSPRLWQTEELVNDPEFSKIIEPISPIGCAGRSGELDTTVLYLASDASKYTTGQIITVDGGWTTIQQQLFCYGWTS